jgi:hypothetical protein
MSVLYRRPQCFRGVLARQVRACADHRIGASANPPMAVMTIYNDAWPAARFYFDFDKAPRECEIAEAENIVITHASAAL